MLIKIFLQILLLLIFVLNGNALSNSINETSQLLEQATPVSSTPQAPSQPVNNIIPIGGTASFDREHTITQQHPVMEAAEGTQVTGYAAPSVEESREVISQKASHIETVVPMIVPTPAAIGPSRSDAEQLEMNRQDLIREWRERGMEGPEFESLLQDEKVVEALTDLKEIIEQAEQNKPSVLRKEQARPSSSDKKRKGKGKAAATVSDSGTTPEAAERVRIPSLIESTYAERAAAENLIEKYKEANEILERVLQERPETGKAVGGILSGVTHWVDNTLAEYQGIVEASPMYQATRAQMMRTKEYVQTEEFKEAARIGIELGLILADAAPQTRILGRVGRAGYELYKGNQFVQSINTKHQEGVMVPTQKTEQLTYQPKDNLTTTTTTSTNTAGSSSLSSSTTSLPVPNSERVGVKFNGNQKEVPELIRRSVTNKEKGIKDNSKNYRQEIFNPDPKNVNNALADRAKKTLQDKGLLNLDEKLTPQAIKTAEKIKPEIEKIKNKEVITELTKDGSKLEDWGKYAIKDIKLSNGESVEIHFYKKNATNEVKYNIDYKIKK